MLKARLLLPALATAALLMTTSACATGYHQRYPNYRQVQDHAYRNGFDEGRAQGENDARRGRSFDYGRHSEYRNAQIGYGGYGVGRGFAAGADSLDGGTILFMRM